MDVACLATRLAANLAANPCMSGWVGRGTPGGCSCCQLDAPALEDLLQGGPDGGDLLDGGARDELWLPDGIDFCAGDSAALDALLVSLTDPPDASPEPGPDREHREESAAAASSHLSLPRSGPAGCAPCSDGSLSAGQLGWGHPALCDPDPDSSPDHPQRAQPAQQPGSQPQAVAHGGSVAVSQLPAGLTESHDTTAVSGTHNLQCAAGTEQWTQQWTQRQNSPFVASQQPVTSSDSAAAPGIRPSRSDAPRGGGTHASPSSSDCKDSNRSSSGCLAPRQPHPSTGVLPVQQVRLRSSMQVYDRSERLTCTYCEGHCTVPWVTCARCMLCLASSCPRPPSHPVP